jgi:5'(3')-deoxyribonucleotidase
MDGVLVDFQSGIDRVDPAMLEEYAASDELGLDDIPGIFSLMDPMSGAIEAVKRIAEKYEVYVLSTAPWSNPSAWSDKLEWIKKHFGDKEGSVFYKRVILSHHKELNRGDYLIDDRTAKGAGDFTGEHIHFGTEAFPDWESVLRYLLPENDA